MLGIRTRGRRVAGAVESIFSLDSATLLSNIFSCLVQTGGQPLVVLLNGPLFAKDFILNP